MKAFLRQSASRVFRKLFWSCFQHLVQEVVLKSPRIFGDESRLKIHPSAQVNDALFNLVSGPVYVGEYAFFGHGVNVITGPHNPALTGEQRKDQFPPEGNDVHISNGVWIGSNATILGPCRIGENAVVGAMALVRADVPANVIVAGVPAKVIRHLDKNALVGQ
ncbi:acyltransferase [Rhodopirellula sallentina]|uniref:Serine O-acetyltransferase n=1 Tax=Rhodopirellula sallentina SM41 TaxID=1263870 RepID=M5U4W5_9BACT|nr:acyltransferase [Rhodopirellula sallentina]EMI56490.1 serine O-acetyltransferase [Rhodopirellula sallentina SM41]